jgi:hypothetical protein
MCDSHGWTYITFTLTDGLSVLNIKFLKINRNGLMKTFISELLISNISEIYSRS